MKNKKLLTILGPTASGKTHFAVEVALALNGEILSGDSRQVYKGMDLGTGKDINEYSTEKGNIPYHLIDIAKAGEKYNVYRFQNDFFSAFDEIHKKNKFPILCGGTGMYIESILKGYKLINVPPDKEFRAWCDKQSYELLVEELKKYKDLHNTTDIDTKKRLIRALEIERFYSSHPEIDVELPKFDSLIIGVDIPREVRRERITKRLAARLEEGMIEEIRSLIEKGIAPEDLIYYGLEYKFVTQYVIGELSFEEMKDKLNIAIHQFAKRQMTWFRGMERRGITIHWVDGTEPRSIMVDKTVQLLRDNNFLI